MSPTADLRVIYLAPHSGTSGVGDYADDFVQAIRPHVRDLIEFRHGPARSESTRGIWRERRRLRDLIASVEDGTPLVVHSELSGGAVVPFWATLGLKARRTATVHDAPRPIWYPFLTRGVSKGRILNQAIHRPLHWLLERFERWAVRDVDLFVLTSTGARRTAELGFGKSVTLARLILPRRAEITASADRPLAVGLFGHVYTGKGFDLIPELRRHLSNDIAVRVAGRGTEALKPTAGVEILGPVEDADEDAFFASIRLLLMPYTRPPVGGRPMLPASGTLLHAQVYRTPTVALGSPDTEFLAEGKLAVVVDGGVAELAAVVDRLARDRAALSELAADISSHLQAIDQEDPAAPFLGVWAKP